jgi:lipid A oxidase
LAKLLIAAGLALLAVPTLPAFAGELEFGAYGGFNESSHTRGYLSYGVTTQSNDFDWEGRSFEAPIYYGLRVTYWPDSLVDWGFGVDFTHAKAYANFSEPAAANNYSVLEFTHGLNLLTANAFRKFEFGGGLRAYAGLGAGISIPHVEITTLPGSLAGATTTSQYQITGPAAQAIVGASYEFAPNWRLFGEYKLSYSINRAELNGGGTFSTNFTTHHLLAGLSYSFDDIGY